MRNVKLSGNKVGSKWIAQAGKHEIELFVENGSKRTIDDLLNALRCLPDPLLWGLSEATLNGVQVHNSIGAAAYASGHGVLLAQHRWDGMAKLLLHEAGHVIYNVTNDRTEINQEDEWLKAMAADDISIQHMEMEDGGKMLLNLDKSISSVYWQVQKSILKIELPWKNSRDYPLSALLLGKCLLSNR